MVEQGFIFFKFSSGPGRDRVPCPDTEISIGDLRTLIGEKKKLPRWDLVISNEETGKPYKKDTALVQKNTTVLVKRTPLLSKRKSEVISAATLRQEPQQKVAKSEVREGAEVICRRAFPVEYLCTLCSLPFVNPHIRTCCGKSACLECLERSNGEACYFCSDAEGEHVPNLRLRESVENLDRRWYYLPGEEFSHSWMEVGTSPAAGSGSPVIPSSPPTSPDHTSKASSHPRTVATIKWEQIRGKEEETISDTGTHKRVKLEANAAETSSSSCAFRNGEHRTRRVKLETIETTKTKKTVSRDHGDNTTTKTVMSSGSTRSSSVTMMMSSSVKIESSVRQTSEKRRVKVESMDSSITSTEMKRERKQQQQRGENDVLTDTNAARDPVIDLEAQGGGESEHAKILLRAWQEHAWAVHFQKEAAAKKMKKTKKRSCMDAWIKSETVELTAQESSA